MKKLGDPIIALTVVGCSVVLLLALAFALQGNPFDHPRRTIRAEFPDITGIQSSSLVKYSGAIAGNVHSIRILTPAERNASPHPENAIEIVLAINNNVPALNEGLTASVASDTLLSDKFVLITGGDPKAPELANNSVVPSIAPVTFDAILRDLSGLMEKMEDIFGGAQKGGLDGILPKVDKLLASLDQTVARAQGLIGNGNGLIDNANGMVKSGSGLIDNAGKLVADGRTLIDSNKDAINRMIAQLSTAADSLDDLAKRTNQLIKDNGKSITSTVKDAQATLVELKPAAISARALADSLRARPQQLIWGPGRPPKSGSN